MEKKKFHLSSGRRVRLLLLLALFGGGLLIYRNYIFGDELLVFGDIGSDTWQQYTMQYASIVNHLRDGTFSFWDFTNGLGTSIFNYSLFDPSLMALYALGVIFGPAHMLFFLVWLQIAKIMAASWMFYWFLSEFSFSWQAKFLAAFCYGFSGYLLVWGQHYQFGMVTVYFPLLLIFCEKYIMGKKYRALFPAAVFLLGIYSAYFTWMSMIGAGFYLLFRVCAEDFSWKKKIGKFLGGCVRMLLGLGMSLGVFLPTAAVLLGVSSRIGQNDSLTELLGEMFSLRSLSYYRTFLLRLFSTNLQNVQGGEYEGSQNYYEAPILFVSTLAVFFAVQFLLLFWKSGKKRRVKITVYAAAAFVTGMLMLKVGGYTFNFFNGQTHRFTFLLSPFVLMTFAWMWDFLKNGGKISIFGVLLVCVGMYWAYRTGYADSIFSEYRLNAVVLGVSGTVMALCLIFSRIWAAVPQKRFLRPLTLGILSVSLAVNVLSEGCTCYTDRLTLKKEDTPGDVIVEEMAAYEEISDGEGTEEEKARALLDRPQNYFRELYGPEIQEALAYLESIDRDFYRVEKDFSSATASMVSLAQGYRGISTYNSVMNSNLQDFVSACCPALFYKGTSILCYWQAGSVSSWVASFTGVRYLLSRSADLDPEEYTLLKEFNGIYVYQLVRETSAARFYDTAVSEESLMALESRKERRRVMNKAIVLEEGESVSSSKELTESEAQKNSTVTLDAPEKDSEITGSIEAASDGYVLFAIPYEDGWTLTIDGEETEILKGDLGFLACAVSGGSHTLTLTYHAPGLAAGLGAGACFWLIYLGAVFLEHRKRSGL